MTDSENDAQGAGEKMSLDEYYGRSYAQTVMQEHPLDAYFDNSHILVSKGVLEDRLTDAWKAGWRAALDEQGKEAEVASPGPAPQYDPMYRAQMLSVALPYLDGARRRAALDSILHSAGVEVPGLVSEDSIAKKEVRTAIEQVYASTVNPASLAALRGLAIALGISL